MRAIVCVILLFVLSIAILVGTAIQDSRARARREEAKQLAAPAIGIPNEGQPSACDFCPIDERTTWERARDDGKWTFDPKDEVVGTAGNGNPLVKRNEIVLEARPAVAEIPELKTDTGHADINGVGQEMR